MPGRIDPVPAEAAPERAITAIFQPLPVAPHVDSAPRFVAGQRGDAVPIAVMRRHEDHRVMRGTAAERTGPRVQDSLWPTFAVALLLHIVGIMTDVKIPAHRRV